MSFDTDDDMDAMLCNVTYDYDMEVVVLAKTEKECFSANEDKISDQVSDVSEFATQDVSEAKACQDEEVAWVGSSDSNESSIPCGQRMPSDDSEEDKIENVASDKNHPGSADKSDENQDKGADSSQSFKRCGIPSLSASEAGTVFPWQIYLPSLDGCELKELVERAIWLTSVAEAYSDEMQTRLERLEPLNAPDVHLQTGSDEDKDNCRVVLPNVVTRLGCAEPTAAPDMHLQTGSYDFEDNCRVALQDVLTGNLPAKTDYEVVQSHRWAQSELKSSLEWLSVDVFCNDYKVAPKYECVYCEKLLSSANALNAHIEIVHQEFRKYACDDDNCEKRFSSTTSRKKHMSVHHSKK